MATKPRFLKPDDEGGWTQDKPDLETNSSTSFIYNPNLSLLLEQQRERLPIFKYKNHILYLLEKYQTLVLVGETGCGKSTQVPQYLLEAGWCEDGKMVGITEPRRVAATTLATRVAEEKSAVLGTAVGYAIRFDDCTSKETKIKYMTEGLLMREMMSDPLLRTYSVIMVDEVHERTLNTDILMGLLKKIIKKRKSLKLIIASATVDAEHLRDFFNINSTKDEDNNTSTILTVEGRLYPVQVFYLKEPVPDYVKDTVETVIKLHTSQPDGDILCFLTGQEEVDQAVSLLLQYSPSNDQLKLFALPMYGSLSNNEQIKVFRRTPRGMRKVVVATNIAETSITIPGIVYVVDCGYVKVKLFDAESRTESLVVVAISQAAAEQRAGRAGRHRPGHVYRLYTEESYQALERESRGEMERCELSGAVLQLKALGIDNVLRFSFPTPPPARSLVSSLELLHALGAISPDAELTRPLGHRMAEFPLSPLHAKAVLASYEFGCTEEMSSMLALLQVRSVFAEGGGREGRLARHKFQVEQGDLLTYLNVYTAYLKHGKSGAWARQNYLNRRALVRATNIKAQIASLLRQFEVPLVSCKGDSEKVCKSIVAGFFSNGAYLDSSGVYRSVMGAKELHIHPSSTLYTLKQPQWVVYCETVHTNRLYMREITVVDPTWLHQLAPHFYHITVDT